jgi:PKD repeat protein
LLSVGGSGVNDNSDLYNVTGISIDSAAAIAYRSLAVYLLRSSDFTEARFYSIRAAIDLFGACSPEVESVTNAWYAVGVGAAYVPGVNSDFVAVDTTACAPPHQVSFTNTSTNGASFFWDFGDGSTSTQVNPTKSYSSFGQFDVSLIVDGGSCGRDTIVKPNYIKVDTAYVCTAFLNNGFNPTQLGCRGKLFDSGGSGGNYSDNENGIMVISPPNASSVTLNFLSFDVEPGSASVCDYDYLEIYDGANIAAPLIGRYCNTTGNPGTISSTGGAITLRFFSDQAVTRSGFEIEWSCNFPSGPPSTNFSVDDDSTCTGQVQFTDFSTELPNAWLWDFGDGNTSTQQNPTHQYQANGNYSVQLIATNNFGSDTTVRANLVSVNRPAAPTITNDTLCIGQSTTLSTAGNGTINWYDQALGGNLLATGNGYTTPALTADQDFFVEDYIAAPTLSVGPANNSFGTGGYGNFDRHLVFDVFRPLILKSVTAYANSSGSRLIELRDQSGAILQSTSVFLTTGTNVISLNFRLPVGIDFQLGLPTNGLKDLYRTNSGLSYPYTIPGYLSITNSNASNPTGFFYYFYNWQVKEEDCVSPRTRVSIKIDSSCTLTSLSEQSQSVRFSLWPNPNQGDFMIVGDEQARIEQVQLYTLSGQEVPLRWSENNQGRCTVETSGLSEGIFILLIQTENGISRKKVTITN